MMLAAAIVATTGATTAAQDPTELPADTIKTNKQVPDSITDQFADIFTQLEGVTVTGTKPVIQSDGAKLTYNVDEDPSSKTNTVLEMLRKVPMVSVDGEDNIRVNGESNFKIYVNGKEEPMLSANASTIFKSMPATAIRKIEVINEPGAKYDAEGSGGILNIVTETQQTINGYLLNATLSLSKMSTAASLYGRTRVNKVTMDANLTYGNSLFGRKDKSESEIEYLDDPLNHFLRESLTQKQKFGFLNGSYNLSWEPDTLNLFTLGVSGMNVAPTVGMNSTIAMYGADGSPVYSYKRNVDTNVGMANFTANASYQRTLGRQGHNLVFTYLYDYSNQHIDLDNYYSDFENFDMELPFSGNRMHYYNNSHTAQIDYVNPINEHHTLEFGAKGLFRRNRSDSWSVGDQEAASPAFDTDHDKLMQFQDIAAAYGSYTGTYGKWGVKAGVRYEYTHMGVDFRTGDQKDFSSILNDVVPNAAITYNFQPAENLRFAYQMRIYRPDIQQLNPYQYSFESNRVTEGNPNLTSERTNVVSLTYSNFMNKVFGSIGIDWRYLHDMITSYEWLNGDIVYNSYGNLGIKNNFRLNGMLGWRITNAMDVTLNGALNYVHYNAGSIDIHKGGMEGNAFLGWNYRLSNGLRLSLNGGGSTRSVTLQGKGSSFYFYGLSASKSFLKEDRLTLSVNASNFLTPYTHFRNYREAPGMITRSDFRIQNWNVGLSVTWKFGSLKSDVRKTDANIDNDDKTQTDNSNSVGGFGM